ncbi:hypothetical protein NX801_14505 [Streptomyces sp. LP05-1]|uniref:Uncharacterized protein n=1 Tax=Streptomyces pyxinae TaxID=2970734 RepID=A0ABT2CHG0_9ACTN|nr:hypothetical protein [Streptomyces sp. LP05-1]MCS0636848.1 hypothetical protein [Streptomyces sp. LP05-1]
MSRYRVRYAGEAEITRARMSPAFRARFEAAMATTLARDPYGHGSSPSDSPKEKNRRLATVAGAIVRYYVAGPPVLVATAVKSIHG